MRPSGTIALAVIISILAGGTDAQNPGAPTIGALSSQQRNLLEDQYLFPVSLTDATGVGDLGIQ